jgi:hypothetical protein
MDKRYQIFVSSTFADLQQERQAVMQALLSLDHFPAGMELFPASDEDQWALIKGVIDDSDYYVLVIGGRYPTFPVCGKCSKTWPAVIIPLILPSLAKTPVPAGVASWSLFSSFKNPTAE